VKKRTRNLLFILGGIALVIIIAVVASRGHGDVATVTAQKVKLGTFQVKLPETGVVQYPRMQTIPTLVPGNIGAIYVQAGAHVTEGQLLATIENPTLQANAAGSQADYQSAAANISSAQVNEQNSKVQYQSSVATAKVNQDEAQRVYDADVNLFRNKAIARNQVDTDRAKLDQARVQYEMSLRQLQLGAVSGYGQNSVQFAQASAVKAQILNAQNQQQVGFTQITAPFSGTIQTVATQQTDTLRSLQVGDAVLAGQTLFTIAEGANYVVRAKVNEQDIAQVTLGQRAIVSGEDFGGKTFPGRVALIAPTAQKSDDPSSTSKQILTTIALDGTSRLLRDGMSADIDILTTNITNALTVPNAAILDKAGKKSVWVVQSGKLHRANVNVGLSNETVTVIKSGLAPVDEVVTQPLPTFVEGAAVKIAPSSSPSPKASAT
jgi:RND family efflux transporter MFP subunit